MYIVSFELIGIILATVLLVAHLTLFDKNDKVRGICFLYITFSILECSLDIFTAKGINGSIHLSDGASIAFNSIYFLVALTCACLGYGLVAKRIGHESTRATVVAAGLLVLGGGLFLVNIFTGIAFTFRNGEYIKTPFFQLFYVLSFAYCGMIIIAMLIHRKELTFKEKMAPNFLVFVLAITFAIQMVFPDLLLTGFGKALAGMVFCVTLELPEHMQMRLAVEELQRAEIEEEQAQNAVLEANRQKTEFLIQMSHELRTPINTILGFGEILTRESAEDGVKESAKELTAYGETLLDLINYLVDFSQLETSRLELNLAEYKIAGVYRMIHNRLHKLLDGTGVSIDNEIATDLPKRLYGDELRISQILEEIAKYILKRNLPGKLTLKALKEKIEKNYVTIVFRTCFQSDGVNIFPDGEWNDIDFLFIKRILEAMDSHLNVEFTQDGVNVFEFAFDQEIVDMKEVGDLKRAFLEQTAEEEAAEESLGFMMPKAKILVVDDTPVNLKVFEGLISPYQVSLTVAGSGLEALQIMKQQAFDLVFMDILMPEMDGEETLKHIRTEDGIVSGEVPVVALTANVFIGARDHYLGSGFCEYITKPVNGVKIAKTLKQFLPEFMETDWAELDVSESQKETEDWLSDLFGGPVEEEKYNGFLGGGLGDGISLPDDANCAKVEEKISVPGLDYGLGLEMCMGNEELYREVAHEYCNNESDQKLEAFLASEDWDNYRILIHGLKSSSAQIGLTDLSEGARKLEDAARALDKAYIFEHHAAWLEQYRDILQSMRACF